MAEYFPTASPVETVLFNALQVLPNSLSGLFSKREPFVGLFSRLNTDRLAVALLSRMAEKYGTEAVWTRALADRSLLLLGRRPRRRCWSALVRTSPPTPRPSGRGWVTSSPAR